MYGVAIPNILEVEYALARKIAIPSYSLHQQYISYKVCSMFFVVAIVVMKYTYITIYIPLYMYDYMNR
jgi:hypothetical protein